MVKAFDPEKARTAAQATIESAEVAKKKLAERLEKAKGKVDEALKAQKAAADAKQKAVDEATRKRDEVQGKIDEQDLVITRQQAYLDATAALDAPVAEEVASTEGQEQEFRPEPETLTV